MTVDTEKLKALALAATPGPWKAIEWTCHAPTTIRAGAVGITVADTTGHGRHSDACAVDAAFIAEANPAAVLELIAEVERLRAEKKQAAQDSFALAWEQALSDAAFYVAGHCANGEHHAEIILEMVAPKLTLDGAQIMAERAEELASGAAKGGGTSENMVVDKSAKNDAKTAETRMDSGFDGGGKLSAPAAGTEKDAVQRVEKRIHNIWEDAQIAWGDACGGPQAYEIFAHRLISAMQDEIDAVAGAHTKAGKEPA
jgi:hypothetical protein